MPFVKDVASDHQAIAWADGSAARLINQVIKDFSSTPEKVDALRYKVKKVKRLLASLSNELTNLDVLGFAHANIE